MPTSPQEVADVLAEAAMCEATRLRDKARKGPLDTADRMSLQFLWRVSADAANAEWSQLHKMDPGKWNDEMLKRALGDAGARS